MNVEKGDEKNTMARQNFKTNHNFNFKDAKMLVNMHNKNNKRLLNLVIYLISILLNKKLIFFHLSPHSVKFVQKRSQDPQFEIAFIDYFISFL